MKPPSFKHAAGALAVMLLIATHGALAAPAASDVEFMNKAAEAGQMEIEASNMAQAKAGSSAVKAFASQMLQDHRAAAAELKRVASTKGVQLPTTPSGSDQKTLEGLGALNGASFDKQYANEVGVKAHTDAVALFRKASAEAKDGDIKEFAKKTLSTLEHHLELAKTMASEISQGKS
ncbi:DUF4142 domain-containing protein [Cupriavidus necator]|uniref:DUF4142 domain-containing protein n=1 Tax=Cupriavidus necator TaxID=106590 RepID=UPI0005B42CFE|nr:DUF4142 domain-containing protein [Cupriavidus necator]